MQFVYDHAVKITLRQYERWILPSSIVRSDFKPLKSLLQVKQDEFQERKKLLNPYSKEKLLAENSASDEELDRLKYLNKVTKMNDMKTFKMTYNRHYNQYGYLKKDFPAEYGTQETALNYSYDPDWSVKFTQRRYNFKKIILISVFLCWFVHRRVIKVEEFDRLKRQE